MEESLHLQEAAWIYRRYGMDAQAAALEARLATLMNGVTEAEIVPGSVTAPAGTMTEGGTFFVTLRNGIRGVFKAGQEATVAQFRARGLDASNAKILVDENAELADAVFSEVSGAHLVSHSVPFEFRGVSGTLHYRLSGVSDAPDEHVMTPLSQVYNFVSGQMDNRPGNGMIFNDSTVAAGMGGEALIDRGSAWVDGTGHGILIWENFVEWRHGLAERADLTPEQRHFSTGSSPYFLYGVMMRYPPEQWLARMREDPVLAHLPIDAKQILKWQRDLRTRVAEIFATEAGGAEAYDYLMGLRREHVERAGAGRLSPSRVDAAWGRVLQLRRWMEELRPRPEWLERRLGRAPPPPSVPRR